MIPHVVSDAQAVRACLAFAAEHRVLVEPACGAALAWAHEGSGVLGELPSETGDVVIEVCGGGVVDIGTLLNLASRLGIDSSEFDVCG